MPPSPSFLTHTQSPTRPAAPNSLTSPTLFPLIRTLFATAEPNAGRGADLPHYSWGQTLSEVTVNVPVPKGTKARGLDVLIGKTKFRVGLKGQPPIVEVGEGKDSGTWGGVSTGNWLGPEAAVSAAAYCGRRAEWGWGRPMGWNRLRTVGRVAECVPAMGDPDYREGVAEEDGCEATDRVVQTEEP